MEKINVGGQAVIEGVMMRAPRAMAIAVRRPTGEIVVKKAGDDSAFRTLSAGETADCAAARWRFFTR